MKTINKQDVIDSAVQAHGAGAFVSKTYAMIVIEQLEDQNKKLLDALMNIKNCREPDLTEYCKSVDSIACHILAKYED